MITFYTIVCAFLVESFLFGQANTTDIIVIGYIVMCAELLLWLKKSFKKDA